MFVTPESIVAAKSASQLAGVVEGQELARMFAWMRPNDLIWNYWVNNYLLGNAPPAFDILYWNNDTTRLPARLHADFLDLIDANPYVNAGRLKVCGTPLDMRRLNLDSYVVAGLTDHITPWQGCYSTAKLYGERSTFVLANSGHIQSLLNPPGNPKAFFWTGAASEAGAEAWLQRAAKHSGSWWPHWLDWIKARSGEMTPAPAELGQRANPPLGAAPGRLRHGEMRCRSAYATSEGRRCASAFDTASRRALRSFSSTGSAPISNWSNPFSTRSTDPRRSSSTCRASAARPRRSLPYRPSTLARLSARLLDQLGHEQVDVLGVSWGGALAQQFAFQQAKRCRRLVLAATSPGHLMVPGKLTVLLKMATPRRYKDPDYMNKVAGDIYWRRIARLAELVRQHLRHVRWSSDYGYYLQLIAGFGWSSLPWLRFLSQPTLVMAGTDDPIVPVANGRILASLIPDARLVTIDDGHLFLVTSADKSAAMISEFLR